MTSPTIGVFALQGDVREHVRMLTDLGVRAIAVRRPAELDACDGLVLPGGESTTMAKLARTFDLFEPLQQRIAEGMPAFGTCAGMILLANGVLDGTADQETLGRHRHDRAPERLRAPGPLVRGGPRVRRVRVAVHAVFIRAPWVERLGEGSKRLPRSPPEKRWVGSSRFARAT